MAQPQHTSSLTSLEEALTVLFCLIDDAYALLNPHGGCVRTTIRRCVFVLCWNAGREARNRFSRGLWPWRHNLFALRSFPCKSALRAPNKTLPGETTPPA